MVYIDGELGERGIQHPARYVDPDGFDVAAAGAEDTGDGDQDYTDRYRY